ncbi:MAG: hypothetical protein LUE99_16630 [Bacteroides sp.]|nr:hypothetical protein [Bacteroides sp.]
MAAWEAAALPYVKAYNLLAAASSDLGLVSIVKSYSVDIEIADCPETLTIDSLGLNMNSSYIYATQKIADYLNGEIADAEDALGKEAVGTTTPATGAYLVLANAKAALKADKDALAAEKASAAPDEQTIKNLEDTIKDDNVAVASAEENVAECKEDLADAKALLKEYNDAIATVQVGSDAQKAYIAALEAAKPLQEAVLVAQYKVHLVEDAMDVIGITAWQRNDATKPQSWSSDGEYGMISDLYNGTVGVETLIAECEKNIADAKKVIAEGNSNSIIGWEYGTVQVYNPNIGNYEYVSGRYPVFGTSKPIISVEDATKLIQAEIDNITAELAIQEALAKKYKADLDAAIAAQPAE